MAENKIIYATGRFEQIVKRKPERFRLQLFITGTTPRSCHAVANLKYFCEQNLEGSYHLEVIDIYQHPELARKEQIIAAPTLVKNHPLPRQVMVGDLSDQERIKRCLGIS
ncbi:MAG: circadian clock KaiB family protein [Syntrophomonadaceae bacterium]